jgi:hypothetical protein
MFCAKLNPVWNDTKAFSDMSLIIGTTTKVGSQGSFIVTMKSFIS